MGMGMGTSLTNLVLCVFAQTVRQSVVLLLQGPAGCRCVRISISISIGIGISVSINIDTSTQPNPLKPTQIYSNPRQSDPREAQSEHVYVPPPPQARQDVVLGDVVVSDGQQRLGHAAHVHLPLLTLALGLDCGGSGRGGGGG